MQVDMCFHAASAALSHISRRLGIEGRLGLFFQPTQDTFVFVAGMAPLQCAGPILVGLLGVANAALYNQVIQTKSGPVRGYPAFNSTPIGGLTNWKDIAVWKGIPFAATTGGEVRQDPRFPSTAMYSGTDYMYRCLQK